MFLLGVVTLCCIVLAGTLALFEPVLGPGPVLGEAPAQHVADSRPIRASNSEPVRVVGAPFVPNTNPRER